MNKNILDEEVQEYINSNINADINKIALAPSSFKNITAVELAAQIAAKKKSIFKLPTWHKSAFIYYPTLLAIEQCSSEPTAKYKAKIAIGETLIDLTAGFGVDSFFFAKKIKKVYSCEISPELAAISAHNAEILGAKNIAVVAKDGIEFLKSSAIVFDTIYIDPARRNQSNKVFKLKDCTPDVTTYLDLFIAKAKRIIIKTAPLLDIKAGLSELKNVSQIHIVSVKNECKELLWVIDHNFTAEATIICASLNETEKKFNFLLSELKSETIFAENTNFKYLYEPDVALLKSGAFNLIGSRYNLIKLHQQSQLYYSNEYQPDFIGRVFEIKSQLSLKELKKDKNLVGNVVVRNFPEKAETLVKKYSIKSSHDDFILFTKTITGYLAIKAKILQHY